MDINGPIRVMHYPHKAIRTELASLVDLAEKLDVNSDFNELEERVKSLNEMVEFHAKGEEDFVYPACDELRNDISKAYLWDHDVDKKYFQGINECISKIKESKNQSDFDDLKSNLFGLKVILTAHADKEDDLIVPMIDAEVPPPQQGEMLAKINEHMPQDRMVPMFKWLLDRISTEDIADYMGIIKQGAPPEQFNGITSIVKGVLSGDQWNELLKLMPGLK